MSTSKCMQPTAGFTPTEPQWPRFPLGRVLATPGALDLLDRTATNASDLLVRHQSGDWGDVPREDAAENEFSVTHGLRILSSYGVSSTERLWIITEADRSATTLLLPEEY